MGRIHRIALTVALLAASATPVLAAEPDQPTSLITSNEAIRILVQNRLSEKFTAASEKKKDEQGALVEFYAVPDQKPLWVDANGLTERGKTVIAEIKDADDYGLRSADYTLPKTDSFTSSGPNATDWLADAEIAVSYAVLDYANDARGGRIKPQRLDENLDPSLALPDPLEVIESIAIRSDPAAYLRSFQPDQPQFEALRQKLIALRAGKTVAVAVKKPADFIPDGPVLKLGVVNAQVALVRKRLGVPLQPDADENTYDMGVALAVQRFQEANGAYGDGAVGLATRRLLNGEPSAQPREGASSAKIRAILINMERWRWLPHDLGPYYVNVNIPEFMLRVVEDGKPVHTTRVVVGKPDKETPVLSNEMQEIVFGPFWNVPTSIKIEEIRPYIREEASWFGGGGFNTAVFQRHNLRIKYAGQEVDPAVVDWNRVDIRSFDIYQPPGPDNVLGKVKFVFPNKHDVYMHDTPQKFLFAQPVRAESHGCMRVENPDQLAAVLLKHDRGWSEARTASAMDDAYDSHVALQQKIPVYITYFTLKVNEDGSLTSYADIYGHDGRMAAALRL
ncbi:MAG TPA: L,D-transpeptidase family protein [Methyloceanibacter sp.]|nr:L,D-transpeptidase family protein [Methyloceanibacter sp.]